MEILQIRCTDVLTYPYLITLLCKLVGVPMLESEEKTLLKLPLLVPKSKNGSGEKPDKEGGEVDKEAEEELEEDE